MIDLLNKIINDNSERISEFCTKRISEIQEAHFKYVHNESSKLKSVVLYNSDNEYLGIRGIEFYCDGYMVSPPHSISYGSVKNNRGFQINRTEKFFLICTKNKQDLNWVRIDFHEPVSIDTIEVYLRKNRGCYRWSNTFCLNIVTESEEKQVINNYVSIDDYVVQLTKQYSSHENYKLISYFIRTIVELKCMYYKRFVTSIDEDVIEYNFNKQELIDFINRYVVLDQKVQYTNAYGFVKTFSIWTDKEKEICLKNTNDVISLLRRFTPYVCYAYGSALGFVREASYFIPHDCDIDIICSFDYRSYESIDAFYDALVPYLVRNGVKIDKKDNWHMHLIYNKQRVDVFPSIITKDEKVLIYPRNKEKLIDYNVMYPTIDIDVLGMACPIPKNVFRYFEIFYGKDWRLPIDKKF